MKNIIFSYHNEIRLFFFIISLILVSYFEFFFPNKHKLKHKLLRWVNNFVLFFMNTLLIKLIFPFVAITFSFYVSEKNIGIFNYFKINPVLCSIISIILLDIIIYFQHYLFHKSTFLWRFHRTHHADINLDVTTGLRFHPIEIIISMFIKLIFILILGPPAIAVLVFEIILNTSSMFNHSNILLNKKVDSFLKKIIITPNMHRIHHSDHIPDQNSNFGFSLSCWDYIFKTYKNMNTNDLNKINIGIKEINTKRELWIDKILIEPFNKVKN